MQKGKPFSRWLMILVMGSLVAVAAGCGQQQLEERNMALEKQLRESLTQNADLQAENDGMRAKNEALQSDLDKAKAQPQTAQQAKGKPKPEFGEGVDVSMVGDTMTVTLPDTILFDSGKATLKSSSKQVLDKIAGVLNRDYATYKIRVEGHTDDQPIVKSKKLWQDNWDLSCNRAMAVLRHLVQKGVDPKRAYAAGYSYYKSVASNSTPAGRAKNRRVAIVVAPR